MTKKDQLNLQFPTIPDRTFFRIGEVSDLTGVKPHVLRYWETEFPMLQPPKSRSNQRLYRRDDVLLILHVKKLLYEEGYTIAGARTRMQEDRLVVSSMLSGQSETVALEEMKTEDTRNLLLAVRRELATLRQMMETQAAGLKSGSA